jgi:hypothetical protein
MRMGRLTRARRGAIDEPDTWPDVTAAGCVVSTGRHPGGPVASIDSSRGPPADVAPSALRFATG